ncbi:uncharacterized protein LOC144432870 [Glandiceps talaboti]
MKLHVLHSSPVRMSLLTVLTSVPLFGLTVWYFFLRRVTGRPQRITKRVKEKPEFPIEYNITNRAVYPCLAGRMLAVACKLGHSFMGTAVLGPDSFKKANYDLLRKLELPEEPVYTPLQPFDGTAAVVDSDCPVDLEKLIKVEKTEDSDFHLDSISDYYEAYRSGKITPMDVAERAIKAIEDSEQLNPKLRAVTQYDVNEIKKMAKSSSDRFRDNSPLSVFDGIPVLVKEEIQTVPYHHRIGTMYLGKTAANEDATVVKKLREAGALILGVSNMHESGMGVSGINPSKLHGTARNPYNTQHCTGGSSSGSASAVGASLCPIALGSDGGGSVRIPASLCGVVGFKPTFGRVSCHGGAPNCYSVLHIGPLANCVRDVALTYAMIAGPDSKFASSINQPILSLDDFEKKDLTGIKVGIDWKYFRDASTEVLGICENALLYVESLGAKVVEIQIPELEETRVAHIAVIAGEMMTGDYDGYNNHLDEMGKDVALLLGSANQFTGADFVQANKQRARSLKFFRDIFEKVDCVITPGTGKTAVKITQADLQYGNVDLDTMNNYMRFMFLGNILGIPGLVVPVGYDEKGLPVSMQIQGKWWNDNTVLRIGHAAEGFLKKKKPQVHYSLLT